MFPALPADWDYTYKLQGPNGQPVDSYDVPGQGSYSIDENGVVTFTPLPAFYGNADRAIVVIDDGYDAKNGQRPSPTASYYPVVRRSTAVLRPGPASAPIGETLTMRPNFAQPSGQPPIDKSTIVFLDADGQPIMDGNNPATSFTVDGEGTWSVDREADEFTFTPVPGFAGDPTPVQYMQKMRRKFLPPLPC